MSSLCSPNNLIHGIQTYNIRPASLKTYKTSARSCKCSSNELVAILMSSKSLSIRFIMCWNMAPDFFWLLLRFFFGMRDAVDVKILFHRWSILYSYSILLNFLPSVDCTRRLSVGFKLVSISIFESISTALIT